MFRNNLTKILDYKDFKLFVNMGYIVKLYNQNETIVTHR